MKALKCISCGGLLVQTEGFEYKCSYCGTHYTIELSDAGVLIKAVKKVSEEVDILKIKYEIETLDKEKKKLQEIIQKHREEGGRVGCVTSICLITALLSGFVAFSLLTHGDGISAIIIAIVFTLPSIILGISGIRTLNNDSKKLDDEMLNIHELENKITKLSNLITASNSTGFIP